MISPAWRRLQELEGLGFNAQDVRELRRLVEQRLCWGDYALELLRKEHPPAIRSVLVDLVRDFIDQEASF